MRVGLEALVAAAERLVRRGVRRGVRVARVVELASSRDSAGSPIRRRCRRHPRRCGWGRAPIGAPMPMSARPSPLKSPPLTANPSSSPPWPVIRNEAEATFSAEGVGARAPARPEEHVDDAGVGPVSVGVRHADRVVGEVVAVDVAEHGDRRARRVGRRVAVDRQARLRQRTDPDAAREHAKAIVAVASASALRGCPRIRRRPIAFPSPVSVTTDPIGSRRCSPPRSLRMRSDAAGASRALAGGLRSSGAGGRAPVSPSRACP